MIKHIIATFLICGFCCALSLCLKAQYIVHENFDGEQTDFTTYGRGKAYPVNGILRVKDVHCIFGDKDMQNYRVSFRARNPEGSEQVQIWAGFRASNRNDRYMVGIKGGLLDQVYLMRLGYMCYCSGWYTPMLNDPKFEAKVKERWKELKPEFEKVVEFIDEQALYLNKAQKHNFEKWDIVNDVVDWVNMPSKGSYEAEVKYLREWYAARVQWMDRELSK